MCTDSRRQSRVLCVLNFYCEWVEDELTIWKIRYHVAVAVFPQINIDVCIRRVCSCDVMPAADEDAAWLLRGGIHKLGNELAYLRTAGIVKCNLAPSRNSLKGLENETCDTCGRSLLTRPAGETYG